MPFILNSDNRRMIFRLHTITGGDRVIVLDHGRVVEQGHPQTLLTDSTSRLDNL